MNLFDINAYVLEQVSSSNLSTNTLELYYDDYQQPYYETHIHEEVIIPEPISIFVSDFNIRRLSLPDTLKVIDLYPCIQTDFEYNMPKSLTTILIRNVNIQNKTFAELFPQEVKYTYENCQLNGVPLNEIVRTKYKKYFGNNPVYTAIRLYNQSIRLNKITSITHKNIINTICQYETACRRGKIFSNTIREGIIEFVWHPRRVEKWIYADIDLDTL